MSRIQTAQSASCCSACGETARSWFAFCPHCGEPLTEPKPLTWEELEQMERKPVWVRDLDIPACSEWFIIWDCWSDEEGKGITIEGGDSMLFEEYYGKTWLAYKYEIEEATNNAG